VVIFRPRELPLGTLAGPARMPEARWRVE
jgi:hypothetical protein